MKGAGLATISRAMAEFVMSANRHVGGSLSPVEFLTAAYFGGTFRLDVATRERPDRDKYVHSKGHAAAAQWFALWLHGYLGNLELSELLSFGSIGHPLPRIPQMDRRYGIEMTTGALGQGLSFGNGLALADRRAGRDCAVLVLLGDAECSEGQVWEAAQTTVRLGLASVTVAVDMNGYGSHMATDRAALPRWWRGFGWHVIEVDGHDIDAVGQALCDARGQPDPTAVMLLTVKGKRLLPPFAGSPDAGGSVPASHRPSYDLEADVALALSVVDEAYHNATRARAASATAPPSELNNGRTTLTVDWNPQRHRPGDAARTKQFAEELADQAGPVGSVLVVTPDAIRQSGLSRMLQDNGSWTWMNPGSPILEHQIAEQDVLSLAAGATAGGAPVVVILQEAFLWRGLDSLRQSICFPGLPVVVVGTSAGIGEDLGPMVQSDVALAAVAALPGLTIFEANDVNEAKILFNEALSVRGPVYLRLPTEDICVLDGLGSLAARDLTEGVWTLRDEPDPEIVLVSAGSLVGHTLEAAEELTAGDGRRVRVLEIFSITRFDRLTDTRRRSLLPDDVPRLSVHNAPTTVLGARLGARSASLGLRDYGGYGGPIEDLYRSCGLGVADIVRRAKSLLSPAPSGTAT